MIQQTSKLISFTVEHNKNDYKDENKVYKHAMWKCVSRLYLGYGVEVDMDVFGLMYLGFHSGKAANER